MTRRSVRVPEREVSRTSAAEPRQLRRDAEINLSRILAAARDAFAEDGYDGTPHAKVGARRVNQMRNATRILGGWAILAAAVSTAPLTPCTAPASATTVTGRSSALLGMQAQYEHSPPTSSDSTSTALSPPRTARSATPAQWAALVARDGITPPM